MEKHDQVKDATNAEDDHKSYVGQYPDTARWPLEIGETVWIVKPEFRAPLGEFLIAEAHPNQLFTLVGKADGVTYVELVEEKYLTRNP